MYLPDAEATRALGRMLGAAMHAEPGGAVIGLGGELGAGKTTLARALIGELGYTGAVVSPSYTLVEPYSLSGRTLYHLDLYRLGDAGELEYLGVRDWDPARDWLLVEWPERGVGHLPPLSLEVRLDYAGEGREASLIPRDGLGRRYCNRIGVDSDDS